MVIVCSMIRLNPNVCLMWYPVDQISPVTRNSQSDLGYTGKFPLYYCSQASGKFHVLKKIKTVKVGDWDDKDDRGDTCQIFPRYNNSNPVDSCNYWCGSNCDNYDAVITHSNGGGSWEYFKAWCIPKKSSTIGIIGTEKKVTDLTTNLDTCDVSFFDQAWAPLGTGFTTVKANGNCDNDPNQCLDYNEANNPTPNLAIYDEVKPPVTSDDVKFPSGTDPEKVYRIACDNLTQLVDSDGNNVAWTGRTSRNSIFTASTPNFFYNTVNNFSYFSTTTNDKPIWAYGRNREDVPFGSAVLPSNYDLANSKPILLRNEYSQKNNETIFAGRPYGCSGPGCGNVGQCNQNPNIFCVYVASSTEFNKQGCAASGSGECAPLWQDPLTISDSQNILNKLFIKKYSDYTLSDYISGGYNKDNSDTSNWAQINMCSPSNSRPSDPKSSFCKVLPSVSNVKIKLDDTIKTFSGDNIVTNGDLYNLEFNSFIDVEQQPLKQIIIDWGDSTQIITNTDSKSKTEDPHKVYHYYTAGSHHIEIKVIDNWGAYRCVAMSNGSWVPDACTKLQ